MQKIVKAARELPIEARRLLSGRYPNFVTSSGNKSLGQQVPVFMFHSVERDLFDAQLNFLRCNQYQTLTLSAFMAFLRGDRQLDGPSVLLTFDDGHKNWYEVAYPLLQSYGFHAVGFLVPTFIQEQPAATAWLSWPEVIEMEQSGVMTFESHTARHDQIYVGPTLVDFFHPHYDHNPLGLDVPWIDEGQAYSNRLRWGTPIYEHTSRYAGRRRFLDDVGVRQVCVEWVERHGGQAFFTRSSWRRELTRQHRTAVNGQRAYAYESPAVQREAILDGLIQARQVLTERLGRPVQHLCYPWGLGCELAVALSREAGYVSNFWVVNDRRNSNRSGDCPFYVPRIKDDYLFRLPGVGRRSMAEIFMMKLQRRSRRLNIY